MNIHNRGRSGGAWVVLLAAGLVACFADDAAAYRRRGSSYNSAAIRQRQQQATIQAAQAQLAAAKQALAAAEATGSDAQSKIDQAVASLREKSSVLHDAQSNTRHLSKEITELEKEILAEQTADSPYGKASGELEAARKQKSDIENKILQGSDAQAALAGLTGAKLIDQRSSLLNTNPDYVQAKARFDTAATELDHQRRELFRSDKDWKETADALTQARKDEKAAEEKTHVGTQGRLGNTQRLRSAAEVKMAAQQAIAQAEAMLRAAGGAKYINSSNSKNNPQRK